MAIEDVTVGFHGDEAVAVTDGGIDADHDDAILVFGDLTSQISFAVIGAESRSAKLSVLAGLMGRALVALGEDRDWDGPPISMEALNRG